MFTPYLPQLPDCLLKRKGGTEKFTLKTDWHTKLLGTVLSLDKMSIYGCTYLFPLLLSRTLKWIAKIRQLMTESKPCLTVHTDAFYSCRLGSHNDKCTLSLINTYLAHVVQVSCLKGWR